MKKKKNERIDRIHGRHLMQTLHYCIINRPLKTRMTKPSNSGVLLSLWFWHGETKENMSFDVYTGTMLYVFCILGPIVFENHIFRPRAVPPTPSLIVVVMHFGIIKFSESLFEFKIILVFTNSYVNFVLLRPSP